MEKLEKFQFKEKPTSEKFNKMVDTINELAEGGGDINIENGGTSTDSNGALKQKSAHSAMAKNSFAEGHNTKTLISGTDLGEGAHAEGSGSITQATAAHAEGSGTKAQAPAAHAEGVSTIAGTLNDQYGGQHAEGSGSKAYGGYSHAEGQNTETNAQALASHVEGGKTYANNEYEHAEGSYNKSNKGASTALKTRHSVGIGDNPDVRPVGGGYNVNAHEIMQNGDHYIYGVGGYNGTNPSEAKSLQEVIEELVDTDVALTNILGE